MTPEERASEIVNTWLVGSHLGEQLCSEVCEAITDAIREAVLAERERAAGVALREIPADDPRGWAVARAIGKTPVAPEVLSHLNPPVVFLPGE